MTVFIKPRRTTTAAKVPTTSDLVDGELGVNVVDQKIYIRIGGTVHEVANVSAGGGSGGGITWSTVAVNTTMAPNNAYIVTGVRNMTLPATTVAGEVYIVHAYSGIVTVVSNGNVITGVGASNNLTIAIGETAQLVVRSAGSLEIV